MSSAEASAGSIISTFFFFGAYLLALFFVVTGAAFDAFFGLAELADDFLAGY